MLRQPYTLRTIRDAEALVALLDKHIQALATVAEGAAAVQSEMGKDPLRVAAAPLRDPVMPGDRSPAFDMDTLVADVTEQSRVRGIEVTDVHVFAAETRWNLAVGRQLSLSDEEGWNVNFLVRVRPPTTSGRQPGDNLYPHDNLSLTLATIPAGSTGGPPRRAHAGSPWTRP